MSHPGKTENVFSATTLFLRFSGISNDAERAAETERQDLLGQIRDALQHSADDAELRVRLQKILDERGDSGADL